ncbi:MAG: hypothetical protein Q7R98_02220 [Candidatus Jorgensenbacteria bacterium]|nr:hypothetical protein [Candidatus Jorgensenbacteria bacterium]
MRISYTFAESCFVRNANLTMRCNPNNVRAPYLRRQGFLTGQATISFILLISGVILQIAIAGSVVTYFLSSSRFNDRLLVRSFIAADAGFRDAEVHIARNLNFVQSGTTAYSITVGSDTAQVTVSRATDATNNVYVYTITSIGTALSRQKKLVGTLLAHQTTGLLEFKSLTEQSVN